MVLQPEATANWVFDAYRVMLICGALIAAALAVMGARHRSEPRAVALACMLVGMADWSLFQALEMSVPGLSGKLLMARLQYLGIAFVPLTWFVTAARVAGNDVWAARRRVMLLSIIPLLTLLLVWTNFHNLYWTDASLVPAGHFSVTKFVRGPGFWLHLTNSYLLLLAGSYLLVREGLRTWQLYRRQALALLLAVLAPWAGNLLFVSGLSPVGVLDLTPLALSVAGMVLAWSIFSQRLFDVVPVALSTVFAILRDALIVLDASDRVVGINQAAKALTGKADAEIIGQPAGKVFSAYAGTVERFGKVESAQAEIALATPLGERVFDLRISPLRDGRGRPGGRLIALRDITERYQAEEDTRVALARERELSDLKSRFISMTSHEFRTPLAGILSSAELLERYSDRWPDDKKLRHLRQIQAATQHMTQLLEDILIIGKAEAGRLEFQPAPVDLAQFCQDLVEEMQRLARSGQAIAYAAHGLEAATCLDHKLVRQILANLLSNALKYSPDGSDVQFSAERSDGRVIFTVADRGIGIPPEDQARLFETFHRAANVGTTPGTGLGLAIVKKAVDLHGGSIDCASAVDQGTMFTVSLPVSRVLEESKP